jgi:hypothetical protein
MAACSLGNFGRRIHFGSRHGGPMQTIRSIVGILRGMAPSGSCSSNTTRKTGGAD